MRFILDAFCARLALMDKEANLVLAYRSARRDFIAACEKAGADAIARVHPARGPDGKPLFCDSAAFGPRGCRRALLLIGERELLTLLQAGFKLPRDARLVLVHALDPHFSAWGKPGLPADWPAKALAAIATEDLSREKKLTVLDIGGIGSKAALAAVLPNAAITFRTVKPEHCEQAIRAAIAAL